MDVDSHGGSIGAAERSGVRPRHQHMRHREPEIGDEREAQSTSATGSDSEATAPTRRPGPVAALHRSVGNQVVRRLHEELGLQAKMELGRPGDEHEREAERVAETVMRTSDAEAARARADDRRGTERGAHRRARSTATGGSGAGPSVPADLEREIASETGGGRSLSAAQRSFFEPRFGRDFGDVRLHTDGRADRLSRSLGARAFTTGCDVFFRSDAYRPNSERGRRLMAHELTHVVQQGSATERAERRRDPSLEVTPLDSSTVARQASGVTFAGVALADWIAGVGAAAGVVGTSASIAKDVGTADVPVRLRNASQNPAISNIATDEQGNFPEKATELITNYLRKDEVLLDVWANEVDDKNVGAKVKLTYHHLPANTPKLEDENGEKRQPVYFVPQGLDEYKTWDGVGWGGDVTFRLVEVPNPTSLRVSRAYGLDVVVQDGDQYVYADLEFVLHPVYGYFAVEASNRLRNGFFDSDVPISV